MTMVLWTFNYTYRRDVLWHRIRHESGILRDRDEHVGSPEVFTGKDEHIKTKYHVFCHFAAKRGMHDGLDFQPMTATLCRLVGARMETMGF